MRPWAFPLRREGRRGHVQLAVRCLAAELPWRGCSVPASRTAFAAATSHVPPPRRLPTQQRVGLRVRPTRAGPQSASPAPTPAAPARTSSGTDRPTVGPRAGDPDRPAGDKAGTLTVIRVSVLAGCGHADFRVPLVSPPPLIQQKHTVHRAVVTHRVTRAGQGTPSQTCLTQARASTAGRAASRALRFFPTALSLGSRRPARPLVARSQSHPRRHGGRGDPAGPRRFTRYSAAVPGIF